MQQFVPVSTFQFLLTGNWVKLNSYGFSGAYKHPLLWNKYYPQEQFVLQRPKIAMQILLYRLLGTSLRWDLSPPLFEALCWYGERWKHNYLLVSRQKLSEALTPPKWEWGRLHSQSQIILQNSSYWYLSCSILFITCCYRTQFWISHLKFTQQNIWDKKLLRVYWLCTWPRERHRTVNVLLTSRKNDFLDWLFWFFYIVQLSLSFLVKILWCK